MNKQQADYALMRAQEVFRDRLAKLEAAHKTPAKSMSCSEKVSALKRGAFMVNAKADIRYSYWHNAIEFSGEHNEKVHKDYPKAAAKLKAAYKKLTDELVLGDAEVALKLLQAFAAGA